MAEKKQPFSDSLQKQLLAFSPLWIIFAIQFNNIIFLFVPAFLILLSTFSFLYSFFAIRKIEGEHNLVSGAIEEEEVQVKLNFRNKGRLPIWLLEVYDNFDATLLPDKKICITNVLRKGFQCEVKYNDYCMRKRGLYKVGPLKIFLEDPFGFFSIRRVLRDIKILSVYPKPLEIERPETIATRKFYTIENQSSLFTGISHLYLGSRDYRRGDDLRYINWKQSARKGNLVVKEMEGEATGSLSIVMDLFEDNKAGFGMKSVIEYQVKIASSIARVCAENNMFFQLLAMSDELLILPFGSGRDHFLNALRLLINIEQASTIRMEYFLRSVDYIIPDNSNVVLIFSSLELELPLFTGFIKNLRHRGCSIFAIFIDNKKFIQYKQKRTKPLEPDVVTELCEQLGVFPIVISPDSNLRESLNSLFLTIV